MTRRIIHVHYIDHQGIHPDRMLKTAVQQGRSQVKIRGVPWGYVEGLNEARTPLADVFSILLDVRVDRAETRQP